MNFGIKAQLLSVKATTKDSDYWIAVSIDSVKDGFGCMTPKEFRDKLHSCAVEEAINDNPTKLRFTEVLNFRSSNFQKCFLKSDRTRVDLDKLKDYVGYYVYFKVNCEFRALKIYNTFFIKPKGMLMIGESADCDLSEEEQQLLEMFP